MCAACSPLGPSPNGLALKPGPQLFSVSGFDFSADPNLPACTPVGVPARGKLVAIILNLRVQLGGWVAVSTTASDTIEIRVKSSSGAGVTGTITGRAADAGAEGPAGFSGRGVTVDFSPHGSASTITAVVVGTSIGTLVGGRANGVIQFQDDATGAIGTCSAVQFSFQSNNQSPRLRPLISQR
jgi:hypothetical protein